MAALTGVPAGMSNQSCGRHPAVSEELMTEGRRLTGNPALASSSVFHCWEMQSKYPKLAAFWTVVTGVERSSIMLTTKSITVPHLTQ